MALELLKDIDQLFHGVSFNLSFSNVSLRIRVRLCICYGLNVCVPRNSYVEILIPNVVTLCVYFALSVYHIEETWCQPVLSLAEVY